MVSMIMRLCGVLYVCVYVCMICSKSLCVLVLDVLFSLSCFALFVVVSMTTMELDKSVFFMCSYVRCRVNVLCFLML